MGKRLAIVALTLSVGLSMPTLAAAVDGDAVIGGAIGGAAGAAIGSAVGGREGAVIGGGLGGAAGAAVATSGKPREKEVVVVHEEEERHHHDNGRHLGHYKHKRHGRGPHDD